MILAYEENNWNEIVDAYDFIGNRLTLHALPEVESKQLERPLSDFHPYVLVATTDKRHFEDVARTPLALNARDRRPRFGSNRKAAAPDFMTLAFPQLLERFQATF